MVLLWLVDAVADLLQISKSEARRYIVEGAVFVGDERVEDPSAKFDATKDIVRIVSPNEARKDRSCP